MPAANILLVDADTAAAAQVGAILTAAGYDLTIVETAAEATARGAGFDLVIVDVLDPGIDAAALTSRLRATSGATLLPILCITRSDDVEERIACLEAGADEVMARPFDARELEARLEALLLRLQRSRSRGLVGDPTASGPGLNRVIVVYSPKGGVGTTTLAVNLATAAAAHAPDRVLLVDLDLQWGQAASHLNVTPGRTIVDLAHDPQAVRDPDLLRSHASRHPAGLAVIAAPASAGLSELVDADLVDGIVRTALEAFDTVVVDAGSDLDARSLTALDLADVVVLPVIPEIPALKPVVQLLEYLNETGSVADKTRIVLNQRFARQLVSTAQIEGLLSMKVTGEIPHDEAAFGRAANEGDPIVRSAPKSPAAQAIGRLASSLLGTAPVAEEKRGLFGRRR